MQTATLRNTFIEYFKAKGHTHLPSASLIPENDNTLLFNNAGMVPFKKYFLDTQAAPYKTIVTSQVCMRAGGKHNDLENVGFTARHHTFFEMLGNFSFGDYFKVQAIEYAWDFLTQVLKLPTEKLLITVHKEDAESADIWLQNIKIKPEKLIYLGDEDNFWAMGDTGPCGPCTEIFYDHGSNIEGGLPGSENEGDRYIEIWNLVFTQFNRNRAGELEKLQHPCVDTGMGLERIAAVMQGVSNNYDTDLFTPLMQKIQHLAMGGDQNLSAANPPSVKVISDHIRSCASLIACGILPSNEGRGYVLRRIIRRAIRHGHKLGITGTFFHSLTPIFVSSLQSVLPYLADNQDVIINTLQEEEEKFLSTLEKGLVKLEQYLPTLTHNTIPGELAFTLYDTFGFPLDLTEDIAGEKGLVVDIDGFNNAMLQQKERSRTSNKFVDATDSIALNFKPTIFHGYDTLTTPGRILAIIVDGRTVDTTGAETVSIVTDDTPFYATGGGQVGDKGVITNQHGAELQVTVTDKVGGHYWHTGLVTSGIFKLGDKVKLQVDASSRKLNAANHSATHLLQAALRKTLGDKVVQKGSLVTVDYLRFDFSYATALSQDQLTAINQLVNDKIRANLKVHIDHMPLEAARKQGALCMESSSYSDIVRVISMADSKATFSMELCGGTHVKRTGDIGLFHIISETNIASGVRRIEALTGDAAILYLNQQTAALAHISLKLQEKSLSNVVNKFDLLCKQLKDANANIVSMQSQLLSTKVPLFVEKAHPIKDIKVVTDKVDNISVKDLKQLAENIVARLSDGIVVLATTCDNKATLVIVSHQNICKTYPANEIAKHISLSIGGKGGGKPQIAQVGSNNIDGLSNTLSSIVPWIEARA